MQSPRRCRCSTTRSGFVPKYNLYLDGTAEFSGSMELPMMDQDIFGAGGVRLARPWNGKVIWRPRRFCRRIKSVTRRVLSGAAR